MFRCAEAEQCGPGAECEPNGYCTFADDSCDTGRRYAEFAGDGLAGVCLPPQTAEGTSGESSDEASDGDGTPLGPSSDSAGSESGRALGSGSGSSPGSDDAGIGPQGGEGPQGSGGTGTGGAETSPGAGTGDGTTGVEEGSTSGASSQVGSDSAADLTSQGGDTLPPPPIVDVVSCFENVLGDGVVDAYWRPPVLVEGAGVVEAGGELRMTLVSEPAFVALESQGARGRIGTRVRLEVLEIPNRQATNTQLLFGVGDGTDRVIFEITAGTIVARNDLLDAGGTVVFQRFGARQFDDNAHRFLQIIVLDDEVSWATSSDGVTFEAFAAPIATPGHLAEADNRTQILGGTFAAQVDPPTPGQVRVRVFQDCDVTPG